MPSPVCFYPYGCVFPYSHLIALYISSVIVQLQINSDIFSWLEFSGILTGVTTTILSALLIFYRIYSVSRKHVLPSSHSRYGRILYLLTESSALYAVGVVLYAIPPEIPLTEANTRWLQRWAWYSDPVFSFASVRNITMMMMQKIHLPIIQSVWLQHSWLRALGLQLMILYRRHRQGKYLHLCSTPEARIYT